jgi:hypothetical protein
MQRHGKSEVRSLNWKPRGEFEAISSEPTPLSVSLRPPVSAYSTRVFPLPERSEVQKPLRKSSLAWKELAARPEKPGLSSPGS